MSEAMAFHAGQACSVLRCCREPDLDAPHHAAREGNDEQGASDHPVLALGIDALRSIGELGFQVVQGGQEPMRRQPGGMRRKPDEVHEVENLRHCGQTDEDPDVDAQPGPSRS